MGKDGGFMTAKAISKRIKAKGLGRLRWYCQMCEKQCRDENGFKCHTQSAGHQRQLSLFSENPNQFINKFSTTFRMEFLSILCQRYGTTTINANTVYQEYIKDKDHIHMNATKWTTLTDFVKDLGKEGLCKVQDRDDGFWIAFVDRQVAEKDRLARERDTKLLEEEYRSERILQRQLKAVKEANNRNSNRQNEYKQNDEQSELDAQQNENVASNGPLSLKINNNNRSFTKYNKKLSNENVLQSLSTSIDLPEHERNKNSKSAKRKSRWDIVSKSNNDIASTSEQEKTTNLEHLQSNHNNTETSETTNASAPWLMKNIVVKVKNSQVGNGAFLGKKGKVIDIIDEYGARISMLDSSTMLELDQDDLETVIPKAGGIVVILSGKFRGQRASIQLINVESFNVSVSLLNSNDDQLHILEYESVSRLCS